MEKLVFSTFVVLEAKVLIIKHQHAPPAQLLSAMNVLSIPVGRLVDFATRDTRYHKTNQHAFHKAVLLTSIFLCFHTVVFS